MNRFLHRVLTACTTIVASWSTLGCGDSADTDELDEYVDQVEQSLMTDEPSNKIAGYRGVVALNLGKPNSDFCTGWMLNSRVVVTAAHCLAEQQGPAVTGIGIDYMRPGVGRDRIHDSSDPVRVVTSNHWDGTSLSMPPFLVPLRPGVDAAKHDVGVIISSRDWVNTSYRDYLRVYDDDMDTLTSVYVYGVGNIFRTKPQRDPNDMLRFSRFQLEPRWFSSDLVIPTQAGETERLCRGDSGGPYIKKIDGLDLVAGQHHGTDRDSSDYCPKPGGRQWGAKLTWSGSDDLDWIIDVTGSRCDVWSPSGPGNNYARCFDLPFVNDAPDREQEHGGKLSAVAQLVALGI